MKGHTLVIRSNNPYLSPDTLICENEHVRAMAELFNVACPHVRRAMFRHVCDWTGVPEAMVADVHENLMVEGTNYYRAKKAAKKRVGCRP